MLAACAIRRFLKIVAISNEAVQTLGKELHALARYTLPEISWAQILASPEGQLIHLIDAQTMAGLRGYVRRNSDSQQFLLESARQQIKAMWDVEKRLLTAIGNYAALLRPDLNSDFRKNRSFQWLEISDRGLSTTPARLAGQAVG